MRKRKHRILYACAIMVTLCLCASQLCMLNVKADDTNYTNTTIYAKDNQGNILGSMTGMFTKGTQLVMEYNTQNLDGEQGRNYFQLRDFTANDNIPYYDVFSYGVKVVNGSYKGKISMTFSLGSKQYNGMNATIIAFNSPNGDDYFGNDDYIAPVDNDKVQVTLPYPSLSNEMVFMIGIPLVNNPAQTPPSNPPANQQPSQMPKTQPSESTQKAYTKMQLTASLKKEKVNVAGDFTKNAKMSVSEINNASASYKKLVAFMPNHKVIGAYDVHVTKDACKGMLDVSFTLSKNYTNKKVTIAHLQEDGNIESKTVKVKPDHTVKMTVSNLSPFMLFGEEHSTTGLDTQQYIEIGGGIILIIVILGCTVAIVKSKKRKV